MPLRLQRTYEGYFGYDFRDVRIRTDPETARAAGASAVTQGATITFAPGEYRPDLPIGRELLAHEVAHVVQQRAVPELTNHPRAMSTAPLGSMQRQAAASTAADERRRAWLEAGTQSTYGTLPAARRVEIATTTRNQGADEILWTLGAMLEHAERIRRLLRENLGPDKDLRVTSVVKAGEHTQFRKMDVARAGTTTWEELAAAAVHAGFWVHAEGVVLGGQLWPLSPAATGAHLDLYLIRRDLGDYPAGGDRGNTG